MCGPLGCLFVRSGVSMLEASAASMLYHMARLFSYAALGALTACLGSGFLGGLYSESISVMPWLCVILLLAVGFGADSRLPRMKWHMQTFGRLRIKLGTLPPLFSAMGVGLLTPFIPCDPLYILLGVTMATGNI